MRAAARLRRRNWGEYENASTYDVRDGFVDDHASECNERGTEDSADGPAVWTIPDHVSARRGSRFRAADFAEDGRAAGAGAEHRAAEEAGGRYRQTAHAGDGVEDRCRQDESKYLIDGRDQEGR